MTANDRTLREINPALRRYMQLAGAEYSEDLDFWPDEPEGGLDTMGDQRLDRRRYTYGCRIVWEDT
jgi:hypothetical protein